MDLEFEPLKPRVVLIVLGVVASAGAVGIGAYMIAAPACDSTRTLDRVSGILHQDFHVESILFNGASTVSGGLFSDNRVCSAEIAEIRGNENASDLPWREIRYRIVREQQFEPADITVQLGGDVPLSPQRPSFWTRLQAYL